MATKPVCILVKISLLQIMFAIDMNVHTKSLGGPLDYTTQQHFFFLVVCSLFTLPVLNARPMKDQIFNCIWDHSTVCTLSLSDLDFCTQKVPYNILFGCSFDAPVNNSTFCHENCGVNSAQDNWQSRSALGSSFPQAQTYQGPYFIWCQSNTATGILQ